MHVTAASLLSLKEGVGNKRKADDDTRSACSKKPMPSRNQDTDIDETVVEGITFMSTKSP